MGIFDKKTVAETQVVQDRQGEGNKAGHGSPEIVDETSIEGNGVGIEHGVAVTTVEELQQKKKGRFAYFKTRNFWLVLVLG